MRQTKSTWMMGLAAAGALALGVQQSDAADIDVFNGINVDTTWTADNEYRLMEPVFVTDGATLTIEPGTVVRGKYQSNGSLIIARGAKINAQGTRENPIVFTARDDDNIGANPGTGFYGQKNNGLTQLWGGVILLGRTYLATNVGEPGSPSPNPALELQIEGITSYGDISKYGGEHDDDDSGVMRFVSIRYGGYVLGDANEINGLTMGGVGRGTELSHIEVFQNKDDGFEWFGGTVNAKYLLEWCGADDSFDWDEGYRGKLQFLMTVQGPLETVLETGDKAFEMDGAMGDGSQPSSIPTVFNVTIVGTGKETGNTKNTPLHFRDGTGGRFYNSLIMDCGGAAALIEGDPNDGSYQAADNFVTPYTPTGLLPPAYAGGVQNGYDHEGVWLSGYQSKRGELAYSIWWKMGLNDVFSCPANSTGLAGVWGAEHNGTSKLDGNKPHFAYPLFTDAALNNYYLDEAAFMSPVANLARDMGMGVPISGKTYYPVSEIDPLHRAAYSEPLMMLGRVPPSDGFFTPVNFFGAFGAQKNWAQGWSLASRLGLIKDSTAGDYVGVVPELRVNAGRLEVKLTADVYAGRVADLYLVNENPTGSVNFTDVLSGGVWNFSTPTVGNFALVDTSWIDVGPAPAAGSTTIFAVDTLPGNGVVDFDQLYFAIQ